MTDLNDHDAAAIRAIGLGPDNAGPTAPMKPEPVKTLRDEIAIAAMSIAATFYDTSEEVLEETATWCYRMADAMLRAREDK